MGRRGCGEEGDGEEERTIGGKERRRGGEGTGKRNRR